MIIAVYLLLFNAAGFLLMHVDKQRARKKAWRISEFTLMAVAALGGSVGSLMGMYVFHHKTRKPKFFIGIPFFLILHIGLAIALFFQ